MTLDILYPIINKSTMNIINFKELWPLYMECIEYFWNDISLDLELE